MMRNLGGMKYQKVLSESESLAFPYPDLPHAKNNIQTIFSKLNDSYLFVFSCSQLCKIWTFDLMKLPKYHTFEKNLLPICFLTSFAAI